MRGSINMCHFHEIVWKGGEKVAQQENGEWEAKGGMCYPYCEILACDTNRSKELQDRHKCDLRWNHQQANNAKEDEVAPRKLHPGKGIGRERANCNRQECPWNSDDQTIEKCLTQSL